MPDQLKDLLLRRSLPAPQAKPNPMHQAVQEFWSKLPAHRMMTEEGLPDVPHPARFQPDVPFVGDPRLAKEARTLLDLDPHIKRRVSSITMGPTRGSMNQMARSQLPLELFSGTNLMGVYSKDDHAIGINPGQYRDEARQTLIHELTHAGGGNDDQALQAEREALQASEIRQAPRIQDLLKALGR